MTNSELYSYYNTDEQRDFFFCNTGGKVCNHAAVFELLCYLAQFSLHLLPLSNSPLSPNPNILSFPARLKKKKHLYLAAN